MYSLKASLVVLLPTVAVLRKENSLIAAAFLTEDHLRPVTLYHG
jgi:hypothetical protein